ncbi:MAG: hypothetical protein AB7U95_28940 [Reyranella sp.]
MMQRKSPKTDKRPRRLYKYRAFSNLMLEMLVEDRLFFADPSTFNDPLDSRPSLDTDLAAPELERIRSIWLLAPTIWEIFGERQVSPICWPHTFLNLR